ncbi:MAG: 6-bladed beta-propeller [Longimicrobiales bacterium]
MRKPAKTQERGGGPRLTVLIAALLLSQQPEQRLPVRELLRLGGDAVDARVSFGSVDRIAIGPQRQIVVMAANDHKVSVFDSAGRFLVSMGRSGSGPGEFQFMTGLRVDSLIHVFDVRQERVSSFDFQGRHRETRRFTLEGLSLAEFVPSGSGVVGATVTRFTRTEAPEREGIIAVVFARGARVDTLITYRGGAGTWFVPNQYAPWGGFPAPTGNGGAWLAFADTIVVADGVTGRVRWFTTTEGSGTPRLLKELSLGLVARRVSDEDRNRFLAELRQKQKDLPPRVQIEAPAHWSVATRILRAPDGTLWIRNGHSGRAGNSYSEIPPGAQTVRRWQLPDGFALHAVHGNRLVGVQTTEFDSPMVVVYQR